MLAFGSSAEEDMCLDLFDLCQQAKDLKLVACAATFNRILKDLGLEELGAWVYDVNPSVEAPYHGADHEMLMTCFAFMGAAYHNLPWSQMRALVAAGCLHDFDHTGALAVPTTDDTNNINRALEGLAEFVHDNPKMLSVDEVALTSALISCTRYPYLHEPTHLLEEIIRDADMCMPYVSQPIRDQLFNGLRQELAASGRVYTPEAFADGVFAFYNASTQHSAWAKAYAEKHNLQRSLQDLSANMRMAECKSLTEGG